MIDIQFPILFQAADSISVRAQRFYVRMTKLDLICVCGAALCGAILPQIPSVGVIGYAVSAVFLGIAVLTEMTIEFRHDENDWYDGRAVAETLKTASWRYMMRAEPYNDSDALADEYLNSVAREALEARDYLCHEIARRSVPDDEVTRQMREIRALPLEERRQLYLDHRALDQRDWYARKAQRNQDLARLFFRIGLASRLAALGAAIYFAFRPSGAGIVEMLATIAAVITAWNELRRHGELARSYALASRELDTLASRIANAASQEDLGGYVLDTENAISREHTMWMAKRLEEPMTAARTLARGLGTGIVTPVD